MAGGGLLDDENEETPGRSAASQAAAEKENGRLEAFSDGVFAIAITLLVLELKVPTPADLAGAPGRQGAPAGLLAALLRQWPAFLAYLTSFLTILVMWVNHHTLFTRVRRVDHPFLYLNGLLLLAITFVPFPTALVALYAQGPEAVTAVAVYCATYLLIAISFNLLWHHASRWGQLLGREVSLAAVEEIDRRYRFGPPLYLVAFLLAFVSVRASIATCTFLALFFSFTGARGGTAKGSASLPI